MATFGNIADGLRISQGSLTSHTCALLNRAEDFSDANYTEEMKYIYSNGDFNEFYKKP